MIGQHTFVLRAFRQKEKEFYVFTADPRVIAQYVVTTEPDSLQETQRPWDESRVRSVAEYVAGDVKWSEDENGSRKWCGFLPNSVLLNATTKCIQRDGHEAILTLPPIVADTDPASVRTLEIIDGQHRLFSFLSDYVSPILSDYNVEPYDLLFVITDNLMPEEKKELFLSMNNFQQKPKKDTIIWMQRLLGIYNQNKSLLVDLIEALNDNGSSILHGKIAIGGVKKLKKNGLLYTGSSFLRPLHRVLSSYEDLASSEPTAPKMFQALNTYLKEWNAVWSGALVDSGPLSSMNAIQYVLELFPTFQLISVRERKTVRDVTAQYLPMLRAQIGGSFFMDNRGTVFASETAARKLVKDHGKVLKRLAHFNEADDE